MGARGRGLLLVGLAVACLVGLRLPASLALFTGSAGSTGDTMTTGSWFFYLHNNPSPPTANTTAQFNLAADTRAPSPATLYNYDTNCDTNRAGRTLNRIAPNPTNATTCSYANWRVAALTSSLTLSGSVTLDIWAGTNTNASNQTGALVVYLRDFNPATGSYGEIANAVYSATYAVGRTWYERVIAVAVPATYTLVAGHRLELKLEASNAGQRNMMVAYDTSACPSSMRVR